MDNKKFKFKRYKVNYKKHYYYIYIPFVYDHIWYVDFGNAWYGGGFFDANIKNLKYLLACFCLLAFNPYAIVYLPISKNKRPNTFAYGDNCEYDVILKTTKVSIKDKDIKKIVRNLNKYFKWTTYKLKVDLDRMRRYFRRTIEKVDKIPCEKILINSDGYLNNGIIHYSFAQEWYQYEAVDLLRYFNKSVFHRNDFSSCYDKEHDYFRPEISCFVYNGKKRDKYTYNKPALTLYIEFYDLSIINRYVKEKVYLVDKNKTDY